MADRDERSDSGAGAPAGPVPCSACRGSGEVVSNLGGTRSLVPCPWCDGGGVRLADHDAQARRRAERPDGPGDGGPEPGGAPGPGGDQAA